CFYCSSPDVQKYGKIKDKQRYKCNHCDKQFLGELGWIIINFGWNMPIGNRHFLSLIHIAV
ncbi:IS1/IS1595 family N-terminal zinc-binding domain-containing protein, partial [Actinobacillus porcinus]|uniref:IS1/IS1595 family N-terminal zinc-binding domain-containing protein n=1 Tax=Actinobacillus porcinus TaxID=51048 RepID=UPI003C6BFDD1|nr:hypothetical protein [Actinobacillus porcinus]